MGTTAVQQGDWYYFRTQDVVFPLDIDDSSVTSFTNHASYPTDWIIDALEPVLDGSVSDATPATIRAANAVARVKPGCYTRDEIEPERVSNKCTRIFRVNEKADCTQGDKLTQNDRLLFFSLVVSSNG